ncbi:MAG TPA: WD40 repeat domain-containing protein [Thermoleophilaceae bacterium]
MVPATPYRGIHPFRYMDHPIFLAREEETHQLASLVAVYRGVMLYGDSGAGKSSLINAALLPRAKMLGFHPERLRVQPRAGQELVLERIAIAEDDSEFLPSLLAPDDDSSRIVLSTEAFEERLRAVCQTDRPLIVFDQFEEILTLFDEAGAAEEQQNVVQLIYKLLREPLPVKLVFAFREDHLGKVKQLLAASPELVDQALRLTPPAVEALPTIIRGPFERHPGHFQRELSPEVAEHLRDALAVHFGAGDLSLSEVQTVCLRLWLADDPDAMLAERGVQGVLEDYLGEALDAFPPVLRGAAIALLSQMVTSAGTRNVMSAEDLMQRVLEEDDDIPRPLLENALERLESESRLVRRERRRDLFLYEITSEFLLPWIRRRRDEFQQMLARHRERRRIRRLGATVGILLLFGAIVAALAIWALNQRSNAEQQAEEASALALASSAEALLQTRPDVALGLALAAFDSGSHRDPRPEVRNSMIAALANARRSGATGMLHGHTSSVGAVAFSRNGRTLTSSSDDGTARLWDTQSHRQIGPPVTTHSDTISSLALSPDGRTVATSTFDEELIRLWDVRAEGGRGRRLGGQNPHALAFSPDGRTLASAGFESESLVDSLRIWDVRSGKTIAQWGNPTDFVNVLALSNDGRVLASAGDDRVIRLWDADSGRRLGPPLQSGEARELAFSRDGLTLASANGGREIRLWDLSAHAEAGEPLPGHGAFALAFSPDGRVLAAAGDDKLIRLWNLRTRRQLGPALAGHTEDVTDIAFSRDGRTLASAGRDRLIRLWDVRAQRRLGPPLTDRSSGVAEVAFSGDAKRLAVVSTDDRIRVWDVRTHRPVGPPLPRDRGSVFDLALSPDGKTLAVVAVEDDAVRLWNVDSQKEEDPLTGQSATAVAFSRDGKMLATAGFESKSIEDTIRIWDLPGHRVLGRPIKTDAGYIGDLEFSRDGKTLASAGNTKLIRLWNVETHEQLRPPLEGHKGTVFDINFSRSGRKIASVAGDEGMRLWSARTHEQMGPSLTGHSAVAAAFSPNGRTLASAGEETIQLWDVRAFRQLGRPLTGHAGNVIDVAFSPDGRSLVSVGGNRIRRWDNIFWRNYDELRSEVCDLVGTSLSRAEWNQYAPGIDYQKTCP